MVESLPAQTLNVVVTGTLGSVTGGSGFITTGGVYQSGITAQGNKGQYCLITYIGGNGGATAEVVLNANYATPTAVPGPITIALPDLKTYGSGYSDTAPPTTASVAKGTTTSCTGTANLTGVMVDDPLSLHGNSLETQTAINPVGVGYNPSSITFNGLTFTLTDFSQGGLTLSCNNAAATVTSGSTDNLSFGSCTFTPKIGSGTFSSSVQFPGTSLPFPIPVPFTGTLNSTSNGTRSEEH